MKQVREIITQLKKHFNRRNREGMARFGINADKAFGVPLSFLRPYAKKIGKNHELALELWKTGYHEARILATLIDSPHTITEKQMDSWVEDFDSWDTCDQCCMNLVSRAPFAFSKAMEFSARKEEFVKRAGFATMASMAVHAKELADKDFAKLLERIKKCSTDERNYVRKAVNWALRQIGKRSIALNKLAVKTAREISALDSKAARWIAADALRELTDPVVVARIRKKK